MNMHFSLRLAVAAVITLASLAAWSPADAARVAVLSNRNADFVANDFAGQEPGTEAEIAEFCSTNYDVSFPMFSKITVTGSSSLPSR